MVNTQSQTGLLTEEEATDYLGGIPTGTLRQWRYLNRGPTYVKVGRHVRYRRSDLDAYIEAGRVEPQGAA